MNDILHVPVYCTAQNWWIKGLGCHIYQILSCSKLSGLGAWVQYILNVEALGLELGCDSVLIRWSGGRLTTGDFHSIRGWLIKMALLQ